MGAKDCRPPGVEVDSRKRESFQRLSTFYSASVKIRRQEKTKDGKSNYRPCSTRNLEATGAAEENLRPFSFGISDRRVPNLG